MSKPLLKANLSPTQSVTEALSVTVLRGGGGETALIKNTGTTACLSSAAECMQLYVINSKEKFIFLENQPCASEVCKI
jgi:hypothetical protein